MSTFKPIKVNLAPLRDEANIMRDDTPKRSNDDTDYDQLIESLKHRLGELRNRADLLEDELRQPLEADFGDQAIDLADDEVLAGTDVIARREIAQVEATLTRIENGSYGRCLSCGDQIADGRLAALPTASRCINCA
jgi:DnaK suppressor protein